MFNQSCICKLNAANKKYLKSKYTDYQLEIISWGGLSESDEFKNFINNKYKKIDESYQNAVDRFNVEYNNLTHEN